MLCEVLDRECVGGSWWVIILRGTVEVRATDGAVRVFGPGTVVHLEDTTGGRPRDARLTGRGLGAFVVAIE
jgi:hypothetical protein